jgi:putative Holliday junction resolvase
VRVLAIDPGTVRLGLALSDPSGTIAFPLKVMRRTTLERDLAEITGIVRDQGVEQILVGLPRRLDGTLDAAADAAKVFAAAIEQATGMPITLWDERLTTVAAERHLVATGMRRERRRATVDQVAAALLLQNYLDSQPRTQALD